MLRLQTRLRLGGSVVGVGRLVIPLRRPLPARLLKMGWTQLHRPFWTRYSQLLNRRTLIELMSLRANRRSLLFQSLPLASCPSLQQGLGNANPPCPQPSPSCSGAQLWACLRRLDSTSMAPRTVGFQLPV
jgi:hypothetical protein